MDFTVIASFIESMGFPIVMVFVLLYFNQKIIGELSETIKNNTTMLEKIMVMINHMTDDKE